MSNDMMMFSTTGQIPAHLQGQNLGITQALLATIGQGGNRIGLKGSRFRLVVNGKEEKVFDENYLDVIIVGVVQYISRMYYEGEYEQDSKARPVCYSVDGVAPPVDLETRQSDKCDTCRWNQLGSRVQNGRKMKACSYFQRLVVMFPGDDSETYYRLDVKALGLFGDSHPTENKFNIRDYAKFVANRGVEVAGLITRLSFDTDQSVPKLLFKPYAFVAPEHFELVRTAVASTEVADLLKINMQTIDLSAEQTAEDNRVVAPEDEATQASTVPANTTVKQQEAQSVQAAQAVAAEPAKKQYRVVPEKLEGFTVKEYLDEGWTKEQLLAEGMIEEVIPTPPAAPQAPAKPAPAPAKPSGPPKPSAAPVASAPVIETVAMPKASAPAAATRAAPKAATQQAATTVQETASDAELDAILAELN